MYVSAPPFAYTSNTDRTAGSVASAAASASRKASARAGFVCAAAVHTRPPPGVYCPVSMTAMGYSGNVRRITHFPSKTAP